MRLAVTRKADQLTELSRQGIKKGIEIVPLPVIQTSPIPFSWPDGLAIGSVDWIVVTSSSGARLFMDRLNTLGISISNNTRFASVGPKTAETLTQYVNAVEFQPSRPYGEVLFEEFLESYPNPGTVVYARGERVNFDPSELMTQHNVEFHSIICYRTLSMTVSSETVQQLDGNDYILFTAPSAVHSYHQQFGRPRARALAIGRTTAGAMNDNGWSSFATIKKANIDQVLEYLK